MPDANEIIRMLISSTGFIALFAFFEVLSRKNKLNPEEMRRVAHVTGTFFGLYVAVYFSKISFIVIASAFSLLMAVSHRKHIFNHIHGVSRKTYGEELLPLGLIASYLIAGSHPGIFIPAFLITGISDPINGFVIHKTKNMTLGFICFWTSAIIILFFSTPLTIFTACGVAFLIGIVERVSSYGTDNFFIPISVALLLSNIL
jgi:dolichol kinase